ncbi:hypothetical protein pdam_00020341 [Pocillopora damicornis]|uniref:S1 motif domain-containing protein n=1 Tax=Pocillopora damicornis TaxID=46731 RepID=A0A3M6V216_POCDA|nr:hypothetical protein pdam_00020341 [Pocillopora damicornis]
MAAKLKGTEKKRRENTMGREKQTSIMANESPLKSRTAASVLAENLQLDVNAIGRVISLLDSDNTVPFIARYRKEETGGLDPTILRQIKAQYELSKSIREHAKSVMKKIGNKLTPDIKRSLDNAVTMEEVDEVKGTHAERSRQLGLGEPAELLLKNPEAVRLEKLVKPGVKGIRTVSEVSLGLQYILADVIAKDSATLNSINALLENNPVRVEACLRRSGKNREKYKKFDGFRKAATSLKAHQVLALNRGEQNKILNVKREIPKNVESEFRTALLEKWVPSNASGAIKKLSKSAVLDAYKRLIQPKIIRQTRVSLTKQAEKESVDIFVMNLYRLLLTPPLRGKNVISLDPGFSHGCKLAVLGSTGEVLGTGVIFLFGENKNQAQAKETVIDLVLKHSCDYIAIGNGVGCRETEKFISKLIEKGAFAPCDVAYCIVSEDGASIYSASPEAEAELPSLDITLRGAVSIGRRLQDPLAELIKIEPKHLGIGMYQHDIPEKLLREALDGVIEDCVSFVGVDLNVAGVSMLRRIAGLNEKKAKAILAWREENGAFVNREQLKEVKGIGSKTYEQCVGFVRIMNTPPPQRNSTKTSAIGQETVIISPDGGEKTKTGGKKRKRESSEEQGLRKKRMKTVVSQNFHPEPLDMTWIHPESYPVARSVMKMLGILPEQIGKPEVKTAIDKFLQTHKIDKLAAKNNVGIATLQHILDGLRQPTDHDIRVNFQKPLFKKNITSLKDIQPGSQLRGRVTNMISFGAFVDCGVGQDGLLHKNDMGQYEGKVGLGDIVEVTVESVDKIKQEIRLVLKEISSSFNPELLVSMANLS